MRFINKKNCKSVSEKEIKENPHYRGCAAGSIQKERSSIMVSSKKLLELLRLIEVLPEYKKQALLTYLSFLQESEEGGTNNG